MRLSSGLVKLQWRAEEGGLQPVLGGATENELCVLSSLSHIITL